MSSGLRFWFALGHGLARVFRVTAQARRSRAHLFPQRPAEQGLRAGECFYCRRKFVYPYPIRGCRGRP